MKVAIGQAVAQVDKRAIAGLSVAGQQHGMVLLGSDGVVLRDAKLWNDTESAGTAEMLTNAMSPPEWAEAVGSVPLAAFTISELAWLASHEPSVLQDVETVLLPHDYLNYRLTGDLATDRGDASGTGYFHPATGTWRIDLLERFVGPGEWNTMLPRVLGPVQPVGLASADAIGSVGLVGRCLVGPGTGDNMAAALGVGLRSNEVAVSIGTSGTVYATHPTPIADSSGTVAGFADATGAFLPLVCTLNATRVTASVAAWLGVAEIGLDTLATEAYGSAGPVLVPYFDGERTPNRPRSTGTLMGLTNAISRPQIAPAAFEGVVCGLLDGLDALNAQTGTEPERIVLVGGAARSPAYRRAVADLSGVPVHVPSGDEMVATGACVQAAAVATGRPIAELQRAWRLGEGQTIDPDSTVEHNAIRDRYPAAMSRTE